jgi:hypothetical protein
MSDVSKWMMLDETEDDDNPSHPIPILYGKGSLSDDESSSSTPPPAPPPPPVLNFSPPYRNPRLFPTAQPIIPPGFDPSREERIAFERHTAKLNMGGWTDHAKFSNMLHGQPPNVHQFELDYEIDYCDLPFTEKCFIWYRHFTTSFSALLVSLWFRLRGANKYHVAGVVLAVVSTIALFTHLSKTRAIPEDRKGKKRAKVYKARSSGANRSRGQHKGQHQSKDKYYVYDPESGESYTIMSDISGLKEKFGNFDWMDIEEMMDAGFEFDPATIGDEGNVGIGGGKWESSSPPPVPPFPSHLTIPAPSSGFPPPLPPFNPRKGTTVSQIEAVPEHETPGYPILRVPTCYYVQGTDLKSDKTFGCSTEPIFGICALPRHTVSAVDRTEVKINNKFISLPTMYQKSKFVEDVVYIQALNSMKMGKGVEFCVDIIPGEPCTVTWAAENELLTATGCVGPRRTIGKLDLVTFIGSTSKGSCGGWVRNAKGQVIGMGSIGYQGSVVKPEFHAMTASWANEIVEFAQKKVVPESSNGASRSGSLNERTWQKRYLKSVSALPIPGKYDDCQCGKKKWQAVDKCAHCRGYPADSQFVPLTEADTSKNEIGGPQ